jgi:hypothetical protein
VGARTPPSKWSKPWQGAAKLPLHSIAVGPREKVLHSEGLGRLAVCRRLRLAQAGANWHARNLALGSVVAIAEAATLTGVGVGGDDGDDDQRRRRHFQPLNQPPDGGRPWVRTSGGYPEGPRLRNAPAASAGCCTAGEGADRPIA